MAEYKDELLDHEYDGIRELDNQLPRWWLWLFYLTIIWSVLYMLYYHVFQIGYLQEDEWRAEMNPDYVRVSEADQRFLGVIPEYHSPLSSPYTDWTPYERMRRSDEPKAVMLTAETDTATYAAVDDPARLEKGQQLFVTNCAQCHGPQGQGLPALGPNLTDRYWIHPPGDMTLIVKSVKYGYPAQGMIPWRGVLSPEDIVNVASFVTTLQGTNPPNPKEPQGELVE